MAMRHHLSSHLLCILVIAGCVQAMPRPGSEAWQVPNPPQQLGPQRKLQQLPNPQPLPQPLPDPASNPQVLPLPDSNTPGPQYNTLQGPQPLGNGASRALHSCGALYKYISSMGLLLYCFV
ncbi:unnamed protein product [Alopecurus aequalis]